MLKLFLIVLLPLVFFSCGQGKEVEAGDTESAFDLSPSDWPKKIPINAKASEILRDWPEFNAMETSFDALYTVENIEDLKLVLENMIEKQKLLAESEYPKTFDISQIKSRQKVFKTYMLKTKSGLEFQQDLGEPILEMVNAYNALRSQFNVVVNNTLDTKLILEDQ